MFKLVHKIVLLKNNETITINDVITFENDILRKNQYHFLNPRKIFVKIGIFIFFHISYIRLFIPKISKFGQF